MRCGIVVALLCVGAVTVSGYATLLALGLEPRDVLYPRVIFDAARIAVTKQKAQLQRETSLGCRDRGCTIYALDGRASLGIAPHSLEPFTEDVLSFTGKEGTLRESVILGDVSEDRYSVLASYTLAPNIFSLKGTADFSVTYSLKNVHENLRGDARLGVLTPETGRYRELDDSQCIRNGLVGMCSGKTTALTTISILVPSDKDGDGVVDATDVCPSVYGVLPEKGCPGASISVRSRLFVFTDPIPQGEETQAAGISVRAYRKGAIQSAHFGVDARSAKTIFEQNVVPPEDACVTDYRGACTLSVARPDNYILVGSLDRGDVNGDGLRDVLYAAEDIEPALFSDRNKDGIAHEAAGSISFISVKSQGENGSIRRDDFPAHSASVFGGTLVYPIMIDSRASGYLLPFVISAGPGGGKMSISLRCDDMPGIHCSPLQRSIGPASVEGRNYVFFHITKDTVTVHKNPVEGAHIDLTLEREGQNASFPLYAVSAGHLSSEGLISKEPSDGNFLLQTLDIGVRE